MSCTLTHQLWGLCGELIETYPRICVTEIESQNSHGCSQFSDTYLELLESTQRWDFLWKCKLFEKWLDWPLMKTFSPIDFLEWNADFFAEIPLKKLTRSLLRPCQRTCRGFLSGAKNSWWIHLPIHLSTDFFEETSVITATLTTPITSASGCRFFFFGNCIQEIWPKLTRPYQRVSSLDKVDKLFLNKG